MTDRNAPFRIEFRPTREGANQLLDVDRYSFYERAVAETMAEHLTNTNNPAWRGEFAVVDIRKPASERVGK